MTASKSRSENHFSKRDQQLVVDAMKRANYTQNKAYFSFQPHVLLTTKDKPPLEMDSAAVTLTEHMVIVFRTSADRADVVFGLHFLDLSGLDFPDEMHATLKTSDGSSLKITSERTQSFIKDLIKGYQLAVPLLPPQLRWTTSLYPGVKVGQRQKLWPSQKFQVQYNSTCSYRSLPSPLDKQQKKILYFPEVPDYYHAQLAYGNHSFDFGEIVPRVHKSPLDPGSILASLRHSGFCVILSITHQTYPDIFKDIAEFLVFSERLQILVVNDVSATIGGKLLSDALQKSQCPICFWDLSSNKISDIATFTVSFKYY
jgi:hypothetical protein